MTRRTIGILPWLVALLSLVLASCDDSGAVSELLANPGSSLDLARVETPFVIFPA